MSRLDTILGDLPDEWGAFEVTEKPLAGPGILLAVTGELDIATVPELRDRLTEAIEGGARAVVLDLRDVTFMDSVAMAAILHARTQLGERGRMAVVLAPDSYTQLVFEIAGLPRCLALFESRADAVTHVTGEAA